MSSLNATVTSRKSPARCNSISRRSAACDRLSIGMNDTRIIAPVGSGLETTDNAETWVGSSFRSNLSLSASAAAAMFFLSSVSRTCQCDGTSMLSRFPTLIRLI